MKFVFVLAILAVAVSVVYAGKTLDKRKKCDGVCTAQYSPICASNPNDPKAKPRSFGSTCVLGLHNCENQANWQKISDGECPGGGGIRLS